MGLRPRYMVLVLALFLLVLGVGTAASVQSGFGSVLVSEVDFQAVDGSWIHSTLQKPIHATSSEPVPGVVVVHGSLQNKEWLMAFGIELARRGFVALTIDVNGHGNSDPGTGSGGAALDYLASLEYVNDSAIGLIGHSMGGGVCWRALSESSVAVDALVLVGSWVPTNISSIPYIPNLLVTVGDFSSLSSYPGNLTPLESSFGVTDVEPGITYGDFGDGTARRVAFGRTNHLFETIEPTIVSETVEWMKDSLKGGTEDAHWISSSDLVYGFWLLGGFIGLFGAILTIFPVLAILLDLPFFSHLRKQPEPKEGMTSKQFLGYGLVYGAIGLTLFFPLLAIGQILDAFIRFPQHFGIPVVSWMLGSAIVSFLVLRMIVRRRDLGFTVNISFKEFLTRFGKYCLPAFLVVGWLYAWTLLVDLGFALDLRVFLPGFNDLTWTRTLFVLPYFFVFLVYALVEGKWLTSVLLTSEKNSWLGTQVSWTVKAMFIKCIPYLIIISFEYGLGVITGVPVVPSMVGFTFLFFYAFTLWFAVATIVILWGYRLTGDYYVGAILNALMFGWLLATILSF
ncbi:MAG: alpha/beta fold hydrolase [Candidatus Thorarchaeota archaeon]|nr:MAG: alpha/beta fold hydrolase [Candidatus Thorarchaeota archaeon]